MIDIKKLKLGDLIVDTKTGDVAECIGLFSNTPDIWETSTALIVGLNNTTFELDEHNVVEWERSYGPTQRVKFINGIKFFYGKKVDWYTIEELEHCEILSSLKPNCFSIDELTQQLKDELK